MHIPYDPLDPDFTVPLRILGGRRPIDFWTSDEIENARLERARRSEAPGPSIDVRARAAGVGLLSNNSDKTVEIQGELYDIITTDDSASDTGCFQGHVTPEKQLAGRGPRSRSAQKTHR
jgi:hypothetical protein